MQGSVDTVHECRRDDTYVLLLFRVHGYRGLWTRVMGVGKLTRNCTYIVSAGSVVPSKVAGVDSVSSNPTVVRIYLLSKMKTRNQLPRARSVGRRDSTRVEEGSNG